MNKYLKLVINSIFTLAIGFVGVLYSLSIFYFGLLFFPEVMTKVDGVLGATPSWLAWHVFPGTIPFFWLLTILTLTVFAMVSTVRLMKKVDIEKAIDAVRADFNKSKAKREVINE